MLFYMPIYKNMTFIHKNEQLINPGRQLEPTGKPYQLMATKHWSALLKTPLSGNTTGSDVPRFFQKVSWLEMVNQTAISVSHKEGSTAAKVGEETQFSSQRTAM